MKNLLPILFLLLLACSTKQQEKSAPAPSIHLLSDFEKRLSEIESIYMANEFEALDITCPNPTAGASNIRTMRHYSMGADSVQICRLWINDVPVYPTSITQGSGISITGSYAGGWTISSTVSAEPAGVVQQYGGTSAPSGYLLCDGSAVSRTTYAALFTAIGTTYGAGDGSTTFNLPNTNGKFPLGKATSGTGNTLGGTGGSIDHVHSVDPPNTTTSVPSANTTAATPLLGSVPTTTHTHTVDISAFNSASANPPFIVFNYIIKY